VTKPYGYTLGIVGLVVLVLLRYWHRGATAAPINTAADEGRPAAS